MSIASDMIRGHTDAIILAQLMQGDSYGYQINRAIELKTGGEYELKEPTLYTAFHRLEQMGCITSYWGDENIGARRRYYSITPLGEKTYYNMLAEWENSLALIETLILPEQNKGKRERQCHDGA